MIRTLRRVARVLPLTRWHTIAPIAIIVFVALSVWIASVYHSVHAVVAFAVPELVVDAEARAAARTAALTLVVSRERVSTCKSAAALVACMGTLACMQFRVSFQIV
jgi:hypothetical protein